MCEMSPHGIVKGAFEGIFWATYFGCTSYPCKLDFKMHPFVSGKSTFGQKQVTNIELLCFMDICHMLSQYVCSAEANNDLSSAICSRMSICLFHVEITDKISIEAFTTLLQTQAVSVRELDLRRAELREEDWHLRGKPGLIGWVDISREL